VGQASRGTAPAARSVRASVPWGPPASPPSRRADSGLPHFGQRQAVAQVPHISARQTSAKWSLWTQSPS
jgi:hypothetical protein